jgi:CheY-like chemotaxis protein
MSDKDLKDLKVLIVEDVEDARLYMRIELEQEGFIVFEAADGRAAVEAAARDKPDIILMDLSLPKMDGLAAAKQIREDERFKNVPLIAVTAHQENDFRAGARDSVFDAYITKPLDVNWLKGLLDRLLT